jgi:hypothetical protein
LRGKKTVLHILLNIAGMSNKTDKLMRMYGQYSTYLGVTKHAKKKEVSDSDNWLNNKV